MVTIRADSDDTGVPPVAAFFGGGVVAAAVGYGARPKTSATVLVGCDAASAR